MNLETETSHQHSAPAATKKKTSDFITREEVKKGFDHTGTVIGGVIKLRDQRIAELSARLRAVENLAAALQQQIKDGATLAFRGAHVPGEAYPVGAAVQFDGHLWIAKRATTEAPGPSEHWTLAVRRGKQGREGKSCPNCAGAAAS